MEREPKFAEKCSKRNKEAGPYDEDRKMILIANRVCERWYNLPFHTICFAHSNRDSFYYQNQQSPTSFEIYFWSCMWPLKLTFVCTAIGKYKQLTLTNIINDNSDAATGWPEFMLGVLDISHRLGNQVGLTQICERQEKLNQYSKHASDEEGIMLLTYWFM